MGKPKQMKSNIAKPVGSNAQSKSRAIHGANRQGAAAPATVAAVGASAESAVPTVAPPPTVVRAGIFGVRHRSLPGVVHFEASWDLAAAADLTTRALEDGSHPCAQLRAVAANCLVREARNSGRRRQPQRERSPAPPGSGYTDCGLGGGISASRQLDGPFEIFVVEEVLGGASAREVAGLEARLQHAAAAASTRHRRQVLHGLLGSVCRVAARAALGRWAVASERARWLEDLAAAVLVFPKIICNSSYPVPSIDP